ncbi:MSC_0624 family F1-like ATPase-associated membrane protein [Mycoplasma sp. 'Moose RK']|uniref:MSC_0624 family F1-like ATPase-associated membrane protein n=1 Tax=Mycoplasma sp. 'Moose RK' TaxID=2780095 RepID=UPI0018C1EABA|nr:hypothetical protein [Mycoplasma sp. 'Moose RK']MBG0730858.1 hypothetical protein [Mycoplasma sp. 'Moose RK']
MESTVKVNQTLQKKTNTVASGQKSHLQFLVRALIAFLIIGLSIGIFFDSSRSLLNINNISQETDAPPIPGVSSISLFFNPIEPEVREFLAPRMTRSVLLLFFSIAFLWKSLKHFRLGQELKKNLVAATFFALFAINIVVYFVWLTTNWTYIFILSLQIFLLIIFDYLIWLWIGKKDDKINYNYKKLLLFKHMSLGATFLLAAILTGIFASMVFSEQGKVTYENPVADWLHTFITEVGKVKNSFILIGILVSGLVIFLLAFSPQIYFYRQTWWGLKKLVSSLSVLIFVIFGVLAYHVYVNIYAMFAFVQFLPFGVNLEPNYLPMFIGIGSLFVFALIYTLINFTSLKQKIKDYRVSLFAFFLLISFVASFASSYQSITIYELIWINLAQIVYFLLIYVIFVRSNPEFATWLKFLTAIFIALYTIFSLIFLVNIEVYTAAVSKIKKEDYQSGLSNNFYIDYSYYFHGTLAIFLAIFCFANLFVAITKNVLILKFKKQAVVIENPAIELDSPTKHMKKKL